MPNYAFNPSLGSQSQFTQLQQGIGYQYGGNIQYGFQQVNDYTGYITARGGFGQVNLYVNPGNPYGNAQQYLRWSGLDARTLGELEKILSVSKKEGKKATALEIIAVVFEGIGKVTEFVKAWKGDRGIAPTNDNWTPGDFGDGAGGGGTYNPPPGGGTGGGIIQWATENKELLAIVLIGGYLAFKK